MLNFFRRPKVEFPNKLIEKYVLEDVFYLSIFRSVDFDALTDEKMDTINSVFRFKFLFDQLIIISRGRVDYYTLNINEEDFAKNENFLKYKNEILDMAKAVNEAVLKVVQHYTKKRVRVKKSGTLVVKPNHKREYSDDFKIPFEGLKDLPIRMSYFHKLEVIDSRRDEAVILEKLLWYYYAWKYFNISAEINEDCIPLFVRFSLSKVASKSDFVDLVNDYGEELAEKIVKKLEEFEKLSNEIEQEFPYAKIQLPTNAIDAKVFLLPIISELEKLQFLPEKVNQKTLNLRSDAQPRYNSEVANLLSRARRLDDLNNSLEYETIKPLVLALSNSVIYDNSPALQKLVKELLEVVNGNGSTPQQNRDEFTRLNNVAEQMFERNKNLNTGIFVKPIYCISALAKGLFTASYVRCKIKTVKDTPPSKAVFRFFLKDEVIQTLSDGEIMYEFNWIKGILAEMNESQRRFNAQVFIDRMGGKSIFACKAELSPGSVNKSIKINHQVLPNGGSLKNVLTSINTIFPTLLYQRPELKTLEVRFGDLDSTKKNRFMLKAKGADMISNITTSVSRIKVDGGLSEIPFFFKSGENTTIEVMSNADEEDKKKVENSITFKIPVDKCLLLPNGVVDVFIGYKQNLHGVTIYKDLDGNIRKIALPENYKNPNITIFCKFSQDSNTDNFGDLTDKALANNPSSLINTCPSVFGISKKSKLYGEILAIRKKITEENISINEVEGLFYSLVSKIKISYSKNSFKLDEDEGNIVLRSVEKITKYRSGKCDDFSIIFALIGNLLGLDILIEVLYSVKRSKKVYSNDAHGRCRILSGGSYKIIEPQHYFSQTNPTNYFKPALTFTQKFQLLKEKIKINFTLTQALKVFGKKNIDEIPEMKFLFYILENALYYNSDSSFQNLKASYKAGQNSKFYTLESSRRSIITFIKRLYKQDKQTLAVYKQLIEYFVNKNKVAKTTSQPSQLPPQSENEYSNSENVLLFLRSICFFTPANSVIVTATYFTRFIKSKLM